MSRGGRRHISDALHLVMLLIEDQLYYCNGRSTVLLEDRLYYLKINYHWRINCCVGRSAVLLEDRLYYRKINYHWKINCCIGRWTVLLEDKLYYWKINCDIGKSVVFSEDQLYWRQSTGIDGNYRSRKITARRWLHKYVGAECGASSFTWYLYQMCNTDVRPSVGLSILWTESCPLCIFNNTCQIHFIFAHLIK